MSNKKEILIEKVEYGESDLKEITLLQFVRWANEEKDVNIKLK